MGAIVWCILCIFMQVHNYVRASFMEKQIRMFCKMNVQICQCMFEKKDSLGSMLTFCRHYVEHRLQSVGGSTWNVCADNQYFWYFKGTVICSEWETMVVFHFSCTCRKTSMLIYRTLYRQIILREASMLIYSKYNWQKSMITGNITG